MASVPDWPTLRAKLEAAGYGLDTRGLYENPETPEAWEEWERLESALGGQEPGWSAVRPHLPFIEAALEMPYDVRSETRTLRRMRATLAIKRAVQGLAAGATEASDREEAVRRFDLAARTAVQSGSSASLIGVLLAVSSYRTVFGAAERIIERRPSPGGNARLRESLARLTLTPWRRVVLGELRFAIASLDRLVAGGSEVEEEIATYPDIRKLALELARPGALDRAKAMVAARYAPALLAPEGPDEWATFERVTSHLEPSRLARFSPDALTRAMSKGSSGVWPTIPRLYRSIVGYSRMLRFASLVADLPPGTTLAEIERLRASLGEEGVDPLLRGPLRIVEHGGEWMFTADSGVQTGALRLPRP